MHLQREDERLYTRHAPACRLDDVLDYNPERMLAWVLLVLFIVAALGVAAFVIYTAAYNPYVPPAQ